MHRDAGRVFAARGGVQRQAAGNNEGHGTEGNMADGFQNRRSQIFLRQRWHCVYVCRLLGMMLPTKRLAFHFLSAPSPPPPPPFFFFLFFFFSFSPSFFFVFCFFISGFYFCFDFVCLSVSPFLLSFLRPFFISYCFVFLCHYFYSSVLIMMWSVVGWYVKVGMTLAFFFYSSVLLMMWSVVGGCQSWNDFAIIFIAPCS